MQDRTLAQVVSPLLATSEAGGLTGASGVVTP
jgi:hypothetical protein